MFLIENIYNAKKWISEKYKMYFTIEGKYTCVLPDKMYLKKVYKARTGQSLNLENPKTFTEKSNWLKLYDRNPLYTIMADKYKAREYIAEKVGEEYLVPLLGVWDSPDEIDFDSLPDQFVLKCNHDNGVIICKDKSQLDIEEVKKNLSARLKRDYYKKRLDETTNIIISGSSAPRGRILDRNGNIIVDNKGVKTIIYNKRIKRKAG